MPEEREVTGLLALMLLTDARRPTRVDADGLPISLEDQDRARWDMRLIGEGRQLLGQALDHDAGYYTIQAAIAALHVEAPTVEHTDWAQIVALYDLLLVRACSPVVAVARAVAVAMRDGPTIGLSLLEELAGDARLRHYHPLPAARAELLRRLSRHDEAIAAYRQALDLVGNEPERSYLARRLDDLTENVAK